MWQEAIFGAAKIRINTSELAWLQSSQPVVYLGSMWLEVAKRIRDCCIGSPLAATTLWLLQTKSAQRQVWLPRQM